MALNNLGLYDDQEVGGVNIIRTEYLETHGFEKVEDETDIQPGDIIRIKDHNGRWCHTFVVESYDKDTKLCTKYDMGSDERVNYQQPYKNVPIVEEAWKNNGESLMDVYRVKK